MNEYEITERLILSAEIESAAHRGRIGPKRDQSLNLGYVHDWADKNGWGKERLREDEIEFQESVAKRPSPQQVSEAEEAWGWLGLVKDEDKRTALAAWAGCMADNKKRFFKDWCKRHGISEKTGRKRKDAAVSIIRAKLVRSDPQDCETGSVEGLPDEAETGHEFGRIGNVWRSDPHLIQQGAEPDFSWVDKRNERRRQREAKRRKLASSQPAAGSSRS